MTNRWTHFGWMSQAVLLAFSSGAFAEEGTYIAVGKAKTKRTVVALTDLGGEGTLRSAGEKAMEVAKADLLFMDQFNLMGKEAFIDKTPSAAPGSFPMEPWKSIGVEFLLKGMTEANPKGFAVEAFLYNVSSGATAFSKRYIAALGDTRSLGHSIANDIVAAITGLPGIFQTKITMVCDRTRFKEIYVMDFDGTNAKQISKHRSTVMGPAWTPDGRKIAYSLIAKNHRNIKNTNLYEFDFTSSSVKLLSDRKGINSGASYAPDGKQIALTMSFLGDPEIFIFNPDSKSVTRLTYSPGVDVDPSFSPDGKKVLFVSGRSGSSMVYKMNTDGSAVERLTFAGRYNATPSWSPKGNKIVFAGWIDGVFDIFMMNGDGTTIERLTKGQGNNEDPSFSPDGGFVVFSSNRAGGKNIYVMNVDGTFVKRLTYGMGQCVSPKWSGAPALN